MIELLTGLVAIPFLQPTGSLGSRQSKLFSNRKHLQSASQMHPRFNNLSAVAVCYGGLFCIALLIISGSLLPCEPGAAQGFFLFGGRFFSLATDWVIK